MENQKSAIGSIAIIVEDYYGFYEATALYTFRSRKHSVNGVYRAQGENKSETINKAKSGAVHSAWKYLEWNF